MATSTENTARFEIPTSTLLRLLADAKQFAHQDGMLPALNAVCFEFAGEDLLVFATDRYALGIGRYPVGRAIVQPTRSVRLDAVAQIEKAFKSPRGIDPTLAVTFGDEGLSVETTATLDGQSTQRLAVEWSPSEKLTSWRALFTPASDEAAVSRAGFRPALLARFLKVQHDPNDSLVVWPKVNNKPWHVTVGDYFTGLIMPTRLPDDFAQWTPSALNVRPEPKRRGKAAA